MVREVKWCAAVIFSVHVGVVAPQQFSCNVGTVSSHPPLSLGRPRALFFLTLLLPILRHLCMCVCVSLGGGHVVCVSCTSWQAHGTWK